MQQVEKTNACTCNNCILQDNFLGIELNEQGLCNFCADPSHSNPNWSKVQVNPQLKQESLEDWKRTVDEMKQHHQEADQYDCIIGYSGGKDSTALVDTFINEYGLKPLLISIDTGYMTDVAKDNIKKTTKKMKLNDNLMIIEDAIPTFSRLYKHQFFSHDSDTEALTVKVCHACTDLIHTIMVKEAMKRGIRHVIIGFSPDQIARYFYETTKEDTLRDGMMKKAFFDAFEQEDMKWFLDEDTSLEALPRVLYPYHVIPYDEQEIISRIESKKLIEMGKGDPVLTNCHVVKAALEYDFKRYGYLTYALQYAELVRQEEDEAKRKKERKRWLRTIQGIIKSIASGTFNREGMRQFYANLGISEKELLQVIEEKRASDPNHESIMRNIEVTTTRRLR